MNASAEPPGRAPLRRQWRSVRLLLAAGAALCGVGALAIGLGDSGFLAQFDLDELALRLRGMDTQEAADTQAQGVARSRESDASDAERLVAAAKSGTPGKEGSSPSDPARPASAHPASVRSPLAGASPQVLGPRATAAGGRENPSPPAAEAEAASPAPQVAPPEGAPGPSASEDPGEKRAPPAPPVAQNPDEPEATVAALPHDRSVARGKPSNFAAEADPAEAAPQVAPPGGAPGPSVSEEPGEKRAPPARPVAQKPDEPEARVAALPRDQGDLVPEDPSHVGTEAEPASPTLRRAAPRPLAQRGRVAAFRGAASPGAKTEALAERPATSGNAAAPWAVAYARGHEAQAEGDLAAAIDWYRQAAELNPRHPAIVYDLGYALQLQGQPYDAISQYRRAIELNPRHAYAYYNLGFLLQTKGYKNKAIGNYLKAASIEPDNPYIYYNLARIMEERSDLAAAQALYEKAVVLEPEQHPGIDARERLAVLAPHAAAAREDTH